MTAIGPWLRKATLAIHIACSIGWLGAVAAYIVLDATAATSQDEMTLRAACISMGLMIWWAIVPLAFAALLTGVVTSLVTPWGLFRHWWTFISLLLTVGATVILLLHTQEIAHRAAMAADPATTADVLRGLGNTLTKSAGGVAVLSLITILNVFKPKGLTSYGRRKQGERKLPSAGAE